MNLKIKKYSDTQKGIEEFISDEIKDAEGLCLEKNLDIVPDPFVKGVWKLSLDPRNNDDIHSIVIYLSGYPDPWGQLREYNDWECYYNIEEEEHESVF